MYRYIRRAQHPLHPGPRFAGGFGGWGCGEDRLRSNNDLRLACLHSFISEASSFLHSFIFLSGGFLCFPFSIFCFSWQAV